MKLFRSLMTLPIFRGLAFLLAALGLVKLSQSTLAAIETPRGALAVLTLAVRNGRRVNIFRMAAALAYRTIFGLIPVLVVSLVVLGSFAKDDQIEDAVKKMLSFAGLSEIVLESRSSDSAVHPSAGWLPIVGDKSQSILPDMAPPAAATGSSPATIEQWITMIVKRVRAVPFGAIGLVGVIALIYAAISMMVEVEQAFNHVCRAPTGRSWARRITQYWTLLTLGPLFLFASFFVGESANSLIVSLSQTQVLSGVKEVMLNAGAKLTAAAISTILLIIVYTTVPNTRVRVGPAVIGATFAALLWEAGKWGFTQYIRSSSSYSTIYGALAVLPLFMLWVYLTWAIVLLGLQLAHALQTYNIIKVQRLRFSLLETGENQGPRIVDPALVLPIAAAVARDFRAGKVVERSRIAAIVGLDDRTTADLLDRLAQVGVVHRVSRGEGDEGFCLARPPEQISVVELLDAARSMTADQGRKREADEAMEMLGKLEETRRAAVRNQTLADYLKAEPTPVRATPAVAAT
jgi:membrane protein